MKTRTRFECDFCGEWERELRIMHDGYWDVPPGITCEECFHGGDTGPCFDDLPLAELEK